MTFLVVFRKDLKWPSFDFYELFSLVGLGFWPLGFYLTLVRVFPSLGNFYFYF